MENNSNLLKNAIQKKKELNEAKSQIANKESALKFKEALNKVLKESKQNKESKEPVIGNLNESIDIDNIDNNDESIDTTEYSIQEIENAFDDAVESDELEIQSTNDDEVTDVDLNAIKEELEYAKKNVPMDQLRKIYDELGELLKQSEETSNNEKYVDDFEAGLKEMFGDGFKDIVGEKYGAMFETYCSRKADSMVNEETEDEIDNDITFQDDMMSEIINKKFKGYRKVDKGIFEEDEIEMGDEISLSDETELEDDPELEESLANNFSNSRRAGAETTPRQEYSSTDRIDKLRYAVRNENLTRRMNGILEENKKLSKKLSESKEENKKNTELLESYSKAIKQHKQQLSEMAVFTANLANVNNLFIDESLSLTFDDKMKIIKEFKNINNVKESQKLYDKFLNEMKSTKNQMVEKINNETQIIESSQPKEPIKEKTALNTLTESHIERIKFKANYNYNKK